MPRPKPSASPAGPQQREAIVYVRVSSREQEDGYSIDAQLKFARDYAANKGLKVVHEFEESQSAKKAGRAKFNDMCEIMRKSKKPMAMIVEKTDRLTRNFNDLVALDDLMNNHDVEIHFFKEGVVLDRNSNSHQKMVFGFKVLIAKGYIDNLSEEARKGMTEKARQGHYPSTAPVGYFNNPKTRLIDLDPVRAPIVRSLFERYATGRYSIEDLVKLAREEGIATTATGRGSVTKTTINRVLKSTFYHGVFTWKGEEYAGMHTPIVSQALYEKVQDVMAGRTGGVFQHREFAFTGLLTCGHCGCMITAEEKVKKSGKRYRYYHCTRNKGPCPRPYIREEKLDAMLAKAMQALELEDDLVTTLKEALKASMVEQKDFHEAAVKQLQADEVRLQQRLRNLVIEKLDGNIDAEAYKDLKGEFEKDLADVQARLANHQRADRAYLQHGLTLIELAQTAYQSYLQRSPAEKRTLLDFVCSNFVLTAEGATPSYRKPFDVLASAGTLTQKSDGLDPSDPAHRTVEYPQRGSNPCYRLERAMS